MKIRATAFALALPAALLLAGCTATAPYTPYPAGKFRPPSAYRHPAASTTRAPEHVPPAEVISPAAADDWSQPVPATETPSMERPAPAEPIPATVTPEPSAAPSVPLEEDHLEPAAEEPPPSQPAVETPPEAPAVMETTAGEADEAPAPTPEDELTAAVPRSRIEEMSERYAQGYPIAAAPAGGAEVDDRQLAADALNRLRDDPLTGRLTFGTSCQNGIVTVEGAVPDEAMRTRALGIVRSTPGVQDVVDRLSRYR